MEHQAQGQRMKQQRETRACEWPGCGKQIDIRGMHAHLEKHEREQKANGAGGKKPPLFTVSTDDPVVKAFEMGFRLGKRAA